MGGGDARRGMAPPRRGGAPGLAPAARGRAPPRPRGAGAGPAAGGETVPRPMPRRWLRNTVDDASEPCPACAGTEWDHVRARDVETLGSVVCRDCGHEEAIAAAIAAPPTAEPPHPTPPARPLSVGFPVYAAAGLEPRPAGSVGDAQGVHTVGVAHGRAPALVVETRAHADELMPDAVVVRNGLEEALRDAAAWPERSPAGLAVWLRTRDRSLRRTAARAPLG